MPRPPRPAAAKSVTKTPDNSAAQQLWVLRDRQPAAMSVTADLSDGRMTEVTGEGLEPGLPVITASSGVTR